MSQQTKPGNRAGLVVLICFLIAAIEGYDIQAFGIAAPQLVADLGLTPAQQGWAYLQRRTCHLASYSWAATLPQG